MKRSLGVLLMAALLALGATLGKAVVAPQPVHASCGTWFPYHIGPIAVDSMYDYTQQKRSAVDFQVSVWAHTDAGSCLYDYWQVMIHEWVEDGSSATFYTYLRLGFQGQGGIWATYSGSPTGHDIYEVTLNAFGCCGAVAWGDDYLDGSGTSYYLNGYFSPSSQTGYSNA